MLFIYRKEGLTPENEKLRENSVAQLNMTPVKTLTSTGSSNNSGVAFSTNTSPGILDASTKLKKRPHDTNIEEVQLNTSLTTPLEGEQSSGKKKSRRETSHPSVAPPPDEDLLQVSSTLQRANMNLRDKLKEAAEKESKLKEDLCTSEKNRAALTKQLSQTTQETQEWKSKYEAQVKLVQNSKEQMESINRDLAEMQNTLQKMNQDFDLQTKNIQAHLKTIEQLKAEKMTVQEENSMMRARMDQHKTRVEKLEDKIRILEAEKKNLIIALDSVKLRSEVVEEGKR
jgi:DNA repair exonuclease SbcCD ATPase subunit